LKLLFDENLGPRLAHELANEHPGSLHVRDVGLRGGTDRQIWDYARTHGFAIVSKDTDFRERSFIEGPPPKVIWLDVGNAGTATILGLLWRERQRILTFETDDQTALLILSIGANAV
jgi:predicted nuclease of predicted toxin-antitoxin system